MNKRRALPAIAALAALAAAPVAAAPHRARLWIEMCGSHLPTPLDLPVPGKRRPETPNGCHGAAASRAEKKR